MMAINASRDNGPASSGTRPRFPLRASIGLAFVTLLMFGLAYSLLATGLGRILFPHMAGGSLIERDGVIVGSALVAQPFANDRYFHSRPSAAGYDPMAVSGSNQARTNPALRKRVEEARSEVAQREGIEPARVPGDLITQSGGGLDPHISPAAAMIQINRVARARGLQASVIADMVAKHTQSPQWGILGQARVNVLELNLALDASNNAGGAQ